LQGEPLVGKVLSRQVQDGGVEFHVVHPLQRGVPQGLRDAPVKPPANEQETSGRRVFQQCVVNRLLGGGRIGHGEQDHAVFVDAPAAFRADTARLP